MEVVAVGAHVDVVERAHGGPAVLVAEGDRRHAVLLDLLAERLEVVEVRGRLVAVLLPDALLVEDRPRVVVERDEVLLAVEARRGLLERLGEVAADLLPDVADVGRQFALGEELHAVAGEPGEHVVGRALEVVVDLLLERVVVDRVDVDRDARDGLELVERLLERALGDGVGVVRAEADGAGGLLGAAAAAAAGLVVVAAPGQAVDDGQAGHAGLHQGPAGEQRHSIRHGISSSSQWQRRTWADSL